MNIGIIPVPAKPVPGPKGSVYAPGRVIANMAKEFTNLGHNVTIFAGKDSTVAEVAIVSANLNSTWHEYGPNETVTYTERRAELDLILTTEAINQFKSGKIDVIHCHDLRLSPYLFHQAEIPVLYTSRYDIETRMTDYDKYRYALIEKSGGGMINLTKKNESTCEKLGLTSYGYAPNGIETENYPLGTGERSGLLFVARLLPSKMVKEAIEAAGLAGEQITVIGPPSPKAEEAQYFAELQSDYFSRPYVKYIGYLESKDLIPYYQQAKVLLYPSLTEGMPNTILEAMATGLPVIASPVGGIPEIIDHNVNGILLKTNTPEEMAEQIKNAAKCDPRLVRKKIEDNFTTQIMAKKLLESYEKFIERQKSKN